MRHASRAQLIIGGLVGLFLVTQVCWIVAFGSPSLGRTRDVSALERVLPLLEQQRVEAFRNQSWCKNIAYAHGRFSETTHASTCNLFDGEPVSFDHQASADFTTLARKLALSGVSVAFIDGTFNAEGQLVSATFSLNCLLCQRTTYLYEPNYRLPPNLGNELWFTPINRNWYLREEDWN